MALTPAEEKRALRQATRLERIDFRVKRAQEMGNTDEVQSLLAERERRELELKLYSLKARE